MGAECSEKQRILNYGSELVQVEHSRSAGPHARSTGPDGWDVDRSKGGHGNLGWIYNVRVLEQSL